MFDGDGVSVWEDEVLEMDSGCGCTTLSMYSIATVLYTYKEWTGKGCVMYILPQ